MKMTSDPRFDAMVEAAAIALCWAGFTQPVSFRGGAKGYWRKVHPTQKDAYRREARACLTAALAAVPGLVVTEVPGESYISPTPGEPASIAAGWKAASMGWNNCRATVLAKAVRP